MSELQSRKPNVVRVGLGVTIHPNPENQYETARIDLSIESEGKPGESVDDTVNRVYDYIDRKLADKVNETRSSYGD